MKKTKRSTGVFILFMTILSLTVSGQRISVNGNEFRVGDEQIWLNGTNTPWDTWNDFGGSFNGILSFRNYKTCILTVPVSGLPAMVIIRGSISVMRDLSVV